MSQAISGPGDRKDEIRSISRAVSVLRALADASSPLSLAQIAAETTLPKPTVQRIVGALLREGLVASNPLGPGYRLGGALAIMAGAVHRDILGLCRPFIEKLSNESRENVDLTYLYGRSVVVIDQVVGQQSLQVVTNRGASLPLHCTASGKAHLSQMAAEQIRTLCDAPFKRFTAKTILDIDMLLADMESCRADDVYVDNEEFFPGILGLSTPLPELQFGNYAVSVSRLSGDSVHHHDMSILREMLMQCRADIGRAAG